jgi:hypothetical protein
MQRTILAGADLVSAAQQGDSAKDAEFAKRQSPEMPAPQRGPIRASCPRVEAELGRRLRDEYDIVHGVLDNGGRPHTVFLSSGDDDSRVHAMVVCSDFGGAPEREPGVVYAARDVREVWFGCSVLRTPGWRSSKAYVDLSPSRVDAADVGSTVLLVEGRRCTAVGSRVVSFELAAGEAVTDLVSYVGNSAVVYGWVETTRGVYVVRGFNCVHDAPAYFAPWGSRRRRGEGSRRPTGLDCVEDPVAAGMVPAPGASVLVAQGGVARARRQPRRRSPTARRTLVRGSKG